MNLWGDVERVLATINRKLADAGDTARIRYMAIRPDYYDDRQSVVSSFWELPDLSPGQDAWPLDTILQYEKMVDEHFDELLSDYLAESTMSLCWFRTKAELEECDNGRPVYRCGQPVREFAQLQ